MLKPFDQKKRVISGGGFLVYLCLSGIMTNLWLEEAVLSDTEGVRVVRMYL